jgi:hypothetical protein
VLLKPTLTDIQALLPSGETSVLAVDLETTGTDPTDPTFAIVGIGFADVRGCFYVDVRALPGPVLAHIKGALLSRPVTAFNVLFDGTALWGWTGSWLNWAMCSFGLFFQLSSEGYTGQRWNLEALQRDVLGWKVSNKTELAELLTRHGLRKETMSKLADLEPQAFGRYCAQDAEAAYQAFYELADATFELGEAGEVLRRYHKEDFLNEVYLLAEQQLRGMSVDVPKLRAFRGWTGLEVAEDLLKFLSHPEVKDVVAEYNAAVVEEHRKLEPPKMIKSGETAARWTKWAQKLERLKLANHFNPGSTQQLAWLFFDKLGHTPRKYTDGGAPSTDKEVLPFLGKSGKHLSGVRKREKLLTYVDACLAKQRDGVLSVSCKSVGSVTGRLAGGELGDE